MDLPTDLNMTDLQLVAFCRKQHARAERLRLELEKIGWMDEFLDADGVRAMMQIARDAVNADEDSGAVEQDVKP